MNTDVGLPRMLDVQEYVNARVREIHSLSLVLHRRSGRPELWGEEPLGPIALVRHMRRRTKSHNRHKVLFRLKKKRPKADAPGLDENRTPLPARPVTRGNGVEENPQEGTPKSEDRSAETDSSNTKLCRRLRRRNELKNPCGGGSWTGGGQRRLESHVWHAKRFSMVHRWGHVLAQSLPGRGRGSRSVLHALRTTTLLHDASYHAQAHLEGPQGCLQAILAVLGGPPSAPSSWGPGQQGLFERAFLGGTCSGSFLLKRGGATLGPAVALWRPSSGGAHQPAEERQLLLILHPAAAEECVQAIRDAVEEQVPEARLVERPDRMCQVELLGAKAWEVLHAVLLPPASSGCHSWAWKLFHHAHKLPQGAVLGLHVVDPRRVRLEGEGVMGEQEDIMVKEEGFASSAALPADATSLWTAFPESGQVAFADCPSLWSPREAPSTELPVAEAVLCERRRQRQLALTRGDPVCDEEEHMVSVMLIKRASAGQGWTLLLPQAWSRVFWVGLVKAGGHAIGLQDHRWAATQACVSLFPYDFPDCPAHHRHRMEEERLNLIEYEKKPKSKRSPAPPLAPTWEDVLSLQQQQSGGELPNQVLPDGIPSVVRTDGWGGGAGGNVRCQLREGKVRWRAVRGIEGRVSNRGEVVAVSVIMPRKGSAEEGALICVATREDFDAWCRSTPKWQGVEDTSTTLLRSVHKSKRQKQKSMQRWQVTALSPVVEKGTQYEEERQALPSIVEKGADCEEERQAENDGGKFREVVGHITSAAPRGSSSGRAIGIYGLDAIHRAKAGQFSEWVGGGETVLALIKSGDSPVYRPALVALLEEGI